MNKQTQEALKMAIDDLELCNGAQTVEDVLIYTHEAIKACKEALAQPSIAELNDEYLRDTHVAGLEQPAQEPVAWLYKRENSSGGWYVVTNYEKENDNGTRNIECYDIPLYTHPAPLWQGLSDDEIEDAWYKLYPLDKNNLWDDMMIGKHLDKFARAIEAKLKEKNHG